MKKIIFSFFIIVTALYSASSESKIIKLIFNSLYDNNITIYTTNKDKIQTLKEAGFLVASTCSKANIVYASKKPKECEDKPLFTDNYHTFIEEKDAIGAFYWKKGRPNILFLKPRLDKFGLKVPTKLKKYVMDEI